jgi:hypothetical protein
VCYLPPRSALSIARPLSLPRVLVYGEPEPIDDGSAAATAHERYYSSHGKPEPQPPSLSNNMRWLPAALIASTLVIATAGATHFRRVRIRRRRAARVTT